jgi:hypothetical protein
VVESLALCTVVLTFNIGDFIQILKKKKMKKIVCGGFMVGINGTSIFRLIQ